jgi:hypothetical protein
MYPLDVHIATALVRDRHDDLRKSYGARRRWRKT